MLKRNLVRQYLLAMLYSDEISQGLILEDGACDIGNIWTNCDGERPRVYDSGTAQLFEDVEQDKWLMNNDDVGIVFNVPQSDYTLTPTDIDTNNLSFNIQIVATAATGCERQDILDVVEERVLYRALSHQEFTHATSGVLLKTFMSWAKENTVKIISRDETSFTGHYTIREMSFTMAVNECVKKTTCNDTPICFDFSKLPSIGDC